MQNGMLLLTSLRWSQALSYMTAEAAAASTIAADCSSDYGSAAVSSGETKAARVARAAAAAAAGWPVDTAENSEQEEREDADCSTTAQPLGALRGLRDVGIMDLSARDDLVYDMDSVLRGEIAHGRELGLVRERMGHCDV
eukprot:CAMPEP_0174719984 /NCGR_PEP_ID=MMETSP1094-20130205/32506_1 /TAXON_ID=156173 /ORGANISM="Chrysochromulina brevifilum, Strain UTEX LB 985" /LENGTH=139 /DNA_ID=CAMNT_0015920397 /DNA_START=97 /DNA_END=517 /DNA_ORIENTATION=+